MYAAKIQFSLALNISQGPTVFPCLTFRKRTQINADDADYKLISVNLRPIGSNYWIALATVLSLLSLFFTLRYDYCNSGT
jgi:hypothetical protein